MKSNLKQIRQSSGFSLQELGDMCGFTKSHIHLLERETGSEPKITTAYAIAKVLNKTVYEIWPDTTEVVEETITVRRIKV